MNIISMEFDGRCVCTKTLNKTDILGTYILFHQIPIKFIIQTSVIWACKEWAKWFGQLRENIIQNININD